jgi:hypothetical protein
MSCTSADNCTAGGYCTDASGQQAFLVSEVNDTLRCIPTGGGRSSTVRAAGRYGTIVDGGPAGLVGFTFALADALLALL